MTMLTKKNLYYGIALCLMTIPYLHSAASSSVPAKSSTSYEELALAQLSIVNNSFKERELITPAGKRAFEAHFNTLPQQFKNDWLLWGIDKDRPYFIWTALENGATVDQDMLTCIECYIRDTKNDNPQNWLRWGLKNQQITVIHESLQRGAHFTGIDGNDTIYDSFFENLDIDLKNQTLIWAFNNNIHPLLEAALENGAHDNLICSALATQLASLPKDYLLQEIKNVWLNFGCFYNAYHIVETTLKLGADPNMLNAQWNPILFSYIDNPITLRLLLSAGADPNRHFIIPGTTEMTSIMYAILEKNGSLESIRLLLEYGAHVDDSVVGRTAAYVATQIITPANMTRVISILELLIEHKTNVNIRTHQALTLLTNALHQRSPLIAKILIDAGCDIYLLSSGRTPLIRALEYLIIYANIHAAGREQPIGNQTVYMRNPQLAEFISSNLTAFDYIDQNLLYIIALLVERGHQIAAKAQERYSADDPIRKKLQEQEHANLTQALRLAGTNPTVRGIIENTTERRTFIETHKLDKIDSYIARYNTERKERFSLTTMRKLADKALLGNKLQQGVFNALRNRETARGSGAKSGAFRYSEDSRPAAICGFTKPLVRLSHEQDPYKNLPTSGPLVTVLRGEEPVPTSSTCRTLHLPSSSPVDPVRVAAALSHLPTRSAAAVRPSPTDDDSKRSLALPNLTDLLPALSSSSSSSSASSSPASSSSLSSSSASVDAASGSGGFLFPGHQDVPHLTAPAAPSSSAATSSSSSSRTAGQKRTRQESDSSETDTGTKRNKNDDGKEEERR